jgi:hypothetical protein
MLKKRPHWAVSIDKYVIGGINTFNQWGMLLLGSFMLSVMGGFGYSILVYLLIIWRLEQLKPSMSVQTHALHRMFVRVLMMQVVFRFSRIIIVVNCRHRFPLCVFAFR